MVVVVYLISSSIGPKTYVGSTFDLKRRIKGHKCDVSGKCTSNILVKEYGKDNLIFTVLETCTNTTRYQCEKYWINFIPNTVNKHWAVKPPISRWISGKFTDSM